MLSRAPFLPPLPLAILLALFALGLSKLNKLPLSNISPLFPLLLGILGCALVGWAFVQFRVHKTSVHPMNFSNNNFLIASGIFRFTRNPIYLGMLFVLLGFSIYLSDLLALVPSLIFFVWINYWQIAVEEIHLQSHFGDAYYIYCQKVRRWF